MLTSSDLNDHMIAKVDLSDIVTGKPVERQMYKIVSVLKTMGIALGVAVVVAGTPTLGADLLPGRITVSGQADVSAAPDMASVTVGVTSQARSADAALAANSQKMNGMMAQLEARGIPAKDIQTSNLNLQPVWNNGSGQTRKITGYQVSNQVHVTLNDLGKLGGLLDLLVEGGANQFYGLNFGLQDPRPSRNKALGMAVARARAKARLLADAAGVELGQLLDMREGGGGFAPQPMAMRAMAMEMDAAPISEGQVSTGANVTLVYEIVSP